MLLILFIYHLFIRVQKKAAFVIFLFTSIKSCSFFDLSLRRDFQIFFYNKGWPSFICVPSSVVGPLEILNDKINLFLLGILHSISLLKVSKVQILAEYKQINSNIHNKKEQNIVPPLLMLRLLLDVVYFHSVNFIHWERYFKKNYHYEKDGVQFWKEYLVWGTFVDEVKPKEKDYEIYGHCM